MTPKPLLGLLTACLLLLLNGCALFPTRVVIQRDLPPDSLLLDIPTPVLEGRRNQDLLNWANSLRCSLVQSNADKAALRAWKAGVAYTPQDDLSCE